jgi:hypothetical protein
VTAPSTTKHAAVPHAVFVQVFDRVRLAGGTVADLAVELRADVRTIEQRLYRVRRRGVDDLPPLRYRPGIHVQRADEFAALADTMLTKIGSHTPRSPREIFAAVRADYGSVGERRLWRCLRRLVETGSIRRIAANASCDIGYVLARDQRRRAA